MATYQFMETNIPELYVKALLNDFCYEIGEHVTDQIATAFFNGVSIILKESKRKDQPVAYVFEAMNGDILAAAIVSFNPSEDPDMPGHWNYVWTFDKSDIPANALIIRNSDESKARPIKSAASEMFFGFKSMDYIYNMGNTLFKIISQWLQDNAKEDEIVEVELEGVFQARCAVEDHEVIKSIELIGETKMIIKDDQDIEV